MALACHQFNAVDSLGNIAPGASVEVVRESSGLLAVLYADRAGTIAKGNPFTADANGFAQFFVTGGAYKITVTSNGSSSTWRYVGIGTASEADTGSTASGVAVQGQWATGTSYTGSLDIVTNRGSSYFCLTTHTSEATTEPGVGLLWATYWVLMAERGGSDPKWRFDSLTTMADPGTGDIRFNNSTLANVTAIAISSLSTEANNPSFDNWQLGWDDSNSAIKGLITLRKVLAPEQYVQFAVTGLTDNSGWNQISVVYVGSSGALFTNLDQVYLSFTRTGDVGNPAGITWTFNASTGVADPGAGLFLLNHASMALATSVVVSDTSNAIGNPNVAPLIATWANSSSVVKGTLIISQISSPQNFAIYSLNDLVDGAGYTELAVSHLVSNGAFSGSCVVSLIRTGDKGDVGPMGSGAVGSVNGLSGDVILTSDEINVSNLFTPVSWTPTGPSLTQHLAGIDGLSVSSSRANLLINGDGRINQRNLSSAADDTYFVDRWYALTQTAPIGVGTTPDPAAGVASFIKLTQSAASPQRMGAAQIVEGLNSKLLRSGKASLSGKIKASVAGDYNYAVLEWTGTIDAVTSDVVLNWASGSFTAGNFFLASNLTVASVGSISLSAGATMDFSLADVNVSASCNNLIVMIWSNATLVQTSTIEFRAKLENGSTISPWVQPFADLEYLRAARYFFRLSTPVTAAAGLSARGSTYIVNSFVTLPALPRAIPTISSSNPAWVAASPSGNQIANFNLATSAYTTITGAPGLTFSSIVGVVLRFYYAFTTASGTSGDLGTFLMGPAAYIDFSMEL